MVNNELWSEAWEDAWQQQPDLAHVFRQAQLAGGVRVSSTKYTRHQTRNGTRVLLWFATSTGVQRPYAAEVDYYVELQQPAGASSAVPGREVLAVLRCYNTKPLRDEPDLAALLLEAKDGDFECSAAGVSVVRAVPLQCIPHALNASKATAADGVAWLSFTPVVGRSKRRVFAMP
jgi:hypothetical protein